MSQSATSNTYEIHSSILGYLICTEGGKILAADLPGRTDEQIIDIAHMLAITSEYHYFKQEDHTEFQFELPEGLLQTYFVEGVGFISIFHRQDIPGASLVAYLTQLGTTFFNSHYPKGSIMPTGLVAFLRDQISGGISSIKQTTPPEKLNDSRVEPDFRPFQEDEAPDASHIGEASTQRDLISQATPTQPSIAKVDLQKCVSVLFFHEVQRVLRLATGHSCPHLVEISLKKMGYTQTKLPESQIEQFLNMLQAQLSEPRHAKVFSENRLSLTLLH
ncbi:MAG: hypothetical protein SGI71_07465 [Verrucomicrobiota bacterium]|nr:hypothetical protein [Verrucomicrobiota bacterium]